MHLGVLFECRLGMLNKKMIKRYADILLGSSSRGARLALDMIPRTHELALMMRNIAELSALSGHSLRRSLRMDVTKKKDRKEIRRLKADNDRLKGKLDSEKERLIELADASLRLRADAVQVTKENQKVEEENEKLRAELEKEKEKGKRSRERIVTLHNDLFDKSLKNDRLNIELNETYQKLTKEAQREYLESDEFKRMFNRMSAPILRNGWRLGVAQVHKMLEEDVPLIPELDKMEIDVKVLFNPEEIQNIEKKPIEWTETFDKGIISFIEEWGKEIKEMFPASDLSNVALFTPAAPVPEAPIASNAPLLIPAAPTTTDGPPASETSLLPLSEQSIPPPTNENASDERGV
ncbi:hypothetical protein Dimus_010616 [Dionaea muscipula]